MVAALLATAGHKDIKSGPPASDAAALTRPATEREAGVPTVVAIDHCRTVLDGSQDEALRRDAMRLLACLYAMSGDCKNLLLLLQSGDAAVLAEDEFERNLVLASDLGRPEETMPNES